MKTHWLFITFEFWKIRTNHLAINSLFTIQLNYPWWLSFRESEDEIFRSKLCGDSWRTGWNRQMCVKGCGPESLELSWNSSYIIVKGLWNIDRGKIFVYFHIQQICSQQLVEKVETNLMSTFSFATYFFK